MLNWKRKVLLQRVLSRIPFGEQFNSCLQAVKRSPLFPDLGFAAETRDRLVPVGRLIRTLSGFLPLEGATVVEVGTGWVPLPTVLLYLAGARVIHTYDIVRRVRWAALRRILQALRGSVDACADAIGQPRRTVDQRLARIEGASSLEQMLDLAGIRYVAPGDVLATGLPDGSIDLFFAYSVFEHLPMELVHAFIREAGRLLRPGTGRFCVALDCVDNFSRFDKSLHPLDYLTYSDAEWNRLVNDRNRYHFNRLRSQEVQEILRGRGAAIDAVREESAPGYAEYVKGLALDARFRRFTPEQNAALSTEIVACFPARATSEVPSFPTS